MVVERAAPEGRELSSTEIPPPSVKDNVLSDTSSIELGNQAKKNLVEESKAKEADESSLSEKSSKVSTKEKEKIVSPSKEQEVTVESVYEAHQDSCSDIGLHETRVTDIPKFQQTQEAVKSSPEHGAELETTSGMFVEHKPGATTYFETSSKSHSEESPQAQSYYELSTSAETKSSGETVSIVQKLEEQQENNTRTPPCKKSFEQRSLSMNITVGSSGVETVKKESLCPISGSFDESEVYPVTPSVESHEPKFPLAVSITPISAESPEDIPAKAETTKPSGKQNSMFEERSSLSEMLDLAGALPQPSLGRREVDHMRRKSVPANVSTLVGSSLARLALVDQTSRAVGRESQLEELGYCVFSEYSGPLPSPADVPSPGHSPHQHFPSMEGGVEELGAIAVEPVYKGIQQPDPKRIVPEASQNTVTEKKDAAVKTTLMLEKAVTSGAKPDRLRIPMSSSKDRLSDIKIQAIPEVDIERDPSREASPIPPDSSFTFTPMETGSKSPDDTPSENQDTTKKAGKDVLSEVETENYFTSEGTGNKQPALDKEKLTPEPKESVKTSKEPDIPSELSQSLGGSSEKDNKKIQGVHGTPARLDGTDEQDTSKTIQDLSAERPPEKGSPKLQISTSIIIIPQAQVEEEQEDEDVEIAEEPHEMMEEAGEPVLPKTAQAKVVKEEEKNENVRVIVRDQELEEDCKSGAEEGSHSGQNSGEGKPAARDSSHLSPRSDDDLPQPTEEGGRDEEVGKEKVAKDLQKNTDEGKKQVVEGERNDQTGEEEEEVCSDEVCEEREERMTEEEDEREKREVEKDIEIGQEVEETSDGLCQTSQPANDETTLDVSILDTDSGWMDSQGTRACKMNTSITC